jgi:putative transposase
MSQKAARFASKGVSWSYRGSEQIYARAMPRVPRLNVPGGVHHVTARGNRKQTIFLELGDQERFLHIVGRTASRFRLRIYAYCLMPNHYHLVLEQPDLRISAGIQYLNGVYAQWFNRRHGFEGHLFQGRFHAVLVESDWHLLELTRYVALNPVRAGLCRDPADWPWSSFGALTRRRVPPFLVNEVLRHFGEDPERARGRFEAFVRDVSLRRARRMAA